MGERNIRRNSVPDRSILFGVSKKLLSLVCTAGLMMAQTPQTAPKPGDDAKFAISTHSVLVPVSVRERNGDVVNGLTPYDFEVYDNNKPQKITEDITSHPISLVLAIQANSSVEHFLPKIDKLGNMVQSSLLGDNGEVAVIAFDHRIQTILPMTADLDKLSPALKKIHAGSSSSVVNDAVMSAINMLRNQPTERRRIVIVIAQNKNGGSEINTREVMAEADVAQVSVYAIDISKIISELTSTPQPNRPNSIPPEARPITAGVIQTPTTDTQNDMGNWVPLIKDVFDLAKTVFIPNPLTVYARYTGGHSYSFMTQKDLEHAISSISETLHSEYMLTYQPSNIDEAGFHQIVVKVKHRDLRITARDGYYWAGEKKTN
jgi:VWFA-related protein